MIAYCQKAIRILAKSASIQWKAFAVDARAPTKTKAPLPSIKSPKCNVPYNDFHKSLMSADGAWTHLQNRFH